MSGGFQIVSNHKKKNNYFRNEDSAEKSLLREFFDAAYKWHEEKEIRI